MRSTSLGPRAIAWGLVFLCVAMVADLVEALVDPAASGNGKQIVAAVTHHEARMVLAGLLLLASAAFLAPGVFRLAQLVGDRGRGIARAAVVLSLLGTLGHAALGGIYLVWTAMVGDGGSHHELIAAIDRANDSGTLAILAPLFFAFPLSIVAFLLSTVRGGLSPRWALVPAIAAPVVGIAGGDSSASTVAALVLLLVATGALSARLLGGGERATPDAAPVPA